MNDYAIAPEPGTVRLERRLPGTPERVWAWLTEPDKRARWLAGGAFDLRVGGRVELTFDHAALSDEKETPARFSHEEHAVMTGEITRLEPPRLLAYTWEWRGERSEVTFELAAEGTGVLLTVTHRRLGDRALMVGVASGWGAHLGILADRLAGVAPRPFWSTHARLEREYAARFGTP